MPRGAHMTYLTSDTQVRRADHTLTFDTIEIPEMNLKTELLAWPHLFQTGCIENNGSQCVAEGIAEGAHTSLLIEARKHP